jgi:hypothetical protein
MVLPDRLVLIGMSVKCEHQEPQVRASISSIATSVLTTIFKDQVQHQI